MIATPPPRTTDRPRLACRRSARQTLYPGKTRMSVKISAVRKVSERHKISICSVTKRAFTSSSLAVTDRMFRWQMITGGLFGAAGAATALVCASESRCGWLSVLAWSGVCRRWDGARTDWCSPVRRRSRELRLLWANKCLTPFLKVEKSVVGFCIFVYQVKTYAFLVNELRCWESCWMSAQKKIDCIRPPISTLYTIIWTH